MIKSIACVATLNGHFACALLLLNGTERASLPLVAAALGVRRKALRMCRHDECAGLLGFAPGAVPAVGLRAMPPSVQLTVLMSEAVASTKQTVFVGGGSVEAHIELLPTDLMAAAEARAAPIAKTNDTAASGSTPQPARGHDVQDAASPNAAAGAEIAYGGEARPGNVRLVADAALGRLVRWLRCLGVDVECFQQPDDVLLCALLDPQRRIITRCKRLRNTRGALFLADNDPKQQLREVIQRYGLRFSSDRALSRCSKCNGAVARRMSADEVASSEEIPLRIRQTVREFFACGRCEKKFWIGPKSDRAVKNVSTAVAPGGALLEERGVCGVLESLQEMGLIDGGHDPYVEGGWMLLADGDIGDNADGVVAQEDVALGGGAPKPLVFRGRR